jgi:hypothetical protein
MNKVKELKPKQVLSNYSGSDATYKMVAAQIKERFGEKEVENYNPYSNCLTFRQWAQQGYRVRRGEKALKSITIVEVKNEAGEVIKKYPRTVNLFYYLQTEKILFA